MIDDCMRSKVLDLVKNFWQEEENLTEVHRLSKGKEPGHRIADYVDEITCELLATEFGGGYETRHGETLARSMGDIWIPSSGIWNPVNVKAGLWNSNGQPNIVSMNRLITQLVSGVIDSYDVLIVKFDFSDAHGFRVHVYFVDILDYLDHVHFDMGPGQMMLREKSFYASLESEGARRHVDIDQRVEDLFRHYEDGYRRLLENREKKLKQIRVQLDTAQWSKGIKQEGLSIGGQKAD